MTDTTKNDRTPKVREISFDGIMPWKDVQLVTGLSRPTIWREEKAGRFPARVQITANRIGWIGSEIKHHLVTRPRVDLELCEAENISVQ